VRIGVLASGRGSILEALLEAHLPIVVVVVDRVCRAAEIATAAGIPSELLRRDSFGPSFDRLAYTESLVDILSTHRVDLVAMAGFATVLDKPIFDTWPGRVINTHPALLPAFRGWHAVEEALAAGVKVSGCTIHIATADVDAGPILSQEAVPVLADDTVESLHERIKQVERRLYPETLAKLAEP
jgi:phosphoribosylglycinamide formyltransferase-1